MQKKVEEEQDVANSLKEFVKRWPKFYYFIFDFFGPVYFGGLNPKSFLHRYQDGGLVLNLGSGNRRLTPDSVNVDSCKYENVDVVADLSKLPYANESVSTIVCTEVLEHVFDIEGAVEEVYRVLRTDGYGYISIPFLYPFHTSPSDYRRWTHVGLKDLFHKFEIVEIGVRSGPFSALATQLCFITSLLLSFGNKKIYWILNYASIFIFFPIKFLDIIANRLPFAIHSSALIYCVVKKK